MTTFPTQPSFARGELSPRLRARIDVDHYKTGLAACENFYVLRQGGLRRRPGMRYIATQKAPGAVVRDFSFVVNNAPQVYALELGGGYIRFHTRVGTVLSGNAPYEVASPYLVSEVAALQFEQIADTIRIVHGAHAPMILKRFAETNWTLTPIVFSDGPYQDIISDGTALHPSSNGGIIQGVTGATTSGLGTAIASNSLAGDGSSTGANAGSFPAWQAFDGDGNTEWMAGSAEQDQWVGFLFDTPKCVTGYVVASSPRNESYAEDNVIYKIPGSLRAPRAWVFEACQDNTTDGSGSWVTLDSQAGITAWGEGERRYFTFANNVRYRKYRLRVTDINQSTSLERPVSIGALKFATGGDDIGVMTLTISDVSKVNNGAGFTVADLGRPIRFLSADAYWHWMKIIAVVSDVQVDVAMHSPPLPDTNGTVSFRLGAFCANAGYPARISTYQDRIVYARTNAEPKTLWLSVTDDYDNFGVTIPGKDDDAIEFTLQDAGEIEWLMDKSELFFGTATATRNFTAADPGKGFSATNFKQGKPIKTGTLPVPPTNTGIAALYVGRLGNTLHEMTYDFSVDGYVAPDVAVLSEHLMRPGIKDMAYAHLPNALLWLVMNDGTLVSMTYEREQHMAALTRHAVGGGGLVTSVCVLPGSTRDEVWFTVRRGGFETIEVLDADFEAGAIADAFFLDCGSTYAGAPVTEVTGLPAGLIGQHVSILSDGAPEPGPVLVRQDGTSHFGKVSLPSGNAGSKIQIGFGYRSTMTTLRIPAPPLGGKKILKKVYVDLLEAGDLKASAVATNASPEQLILRSTDNTMDDAVPLFTGSKPVRVSDRWENAGQVTLTVDDPLPCTILAVTAGFESEP